LARPQKRSLRKPPLRAEDVVIAHYILENKFPQALPGHIPNNI